MRLVRTIFIWLLAVSWLPATLHCAIEQAGLIEGDQDSCCAVDDHEETTPLDSCVKDNCGVLENGVIKHASNPLKVSAPALLLCLSCLVDVSPERLETPRISPATTGSPPELPCTWQFTMRAAQAPRAPSIAS